MGDRRKEDRRMGDRRKEDRRAIEKENPNNSVKNIIIYTVVIILITAVVVASIFYAKNEEEKQYQEDETFEDSEYEGEDDEEYEQSPYHCDISIVGDKEKAKAGEIVNYEIRAENIEAKDGIIMFEADLLYNEEIFEYEIKTNEDSQWNLTGNIEDSITMTRKDLLPNSENQLIATIQFKVKDNAEIGDESIDLTDIKLTMDNNETFMEYDQSADIEIIE